ncbi:MAG: DUF1015 domain-containing protein [Candidatus Marinimicrobia bacterium]|jgi:uncharacterized protein (DUF1015 family)|nr:hypothetical protein [Candidatus Neomarinimicrobiota bacterium]MDP6457581.1 DUF1015 domain-containing protein [Candidatus Neomarinimicrobiota bacterium]MDP6594067.1 DUF1015 domain-containing protein [Candidatus Neomarinimicrobiota bacterium]|tara:strand:+ start:589 stop:1854 length:1266 start_codon:yes stop_codon:yes gene_type:complete
MPDVRPFKGYTYNLEIVGDYANVAAPPYDIISPIIRKKLNEQSEYNLVNITLPHLDNDSNPAVNSYARAGDLWRQWQKEGIVTQLPEAGIWRLRETFVSPLGQKMRRTGFISELRLAPYTTSNVVGHERTHAKPKLDRIKLMEATHAHLSPIFFVYHDNPEETRRLNKAFDAYPSAKSRTDFGSPVDLELTAVTDSSLTQYFEKTLADLPALIADGHHRCEASLTFHSDSSLSEGLDSAYIMAYLVPASSKGLVIYPTHRGFHSLKNFDDNYFYSQLEEYFTFGDKTANQDLPIMTYLRPDLKHDVITLKEEKYLQLKSELKPSSLADLDVVICEEVIVKKIFGLSEDDISHKKYIHYFRSEDECAEEIKDGNVQMAFLMAPMPIESLLSVMENNGILPQKSTYFYPKCPTGLVMRSMEMT